MRNFGKECLSFIFENISPVNYVIQGFYIDQKHIVMLLEDNFSNLIPQSTIFYVLTKVDQNIRLDAFGECPRKLN